MENAEPMAETDLVSVILPVYNGEAFIAEALDSIIFQTYQNLEIIVVDDGSKDKTVDIVRSFMEKDRRITLLQQSNSGVAAARNLAIEYSQGEFIAPIDADDLWYPKNIEKQVQLMQKLGGSVGLTYAWSAYIDHKSTLIGGFKASCCQGKVYLPLVVGNFVGNASAALIRRCCLDKVGGYDSKLKAQDAQGCEDWDLYLRIAKEYRFGVVPEFLIGYRQLAKSMSCNYDTMYKSYQLVMSDVKKLNPEIPSDIYKKSRLNYYRYLFLQSQRTGEHQAGLSWLHQIFRLDLTFFWKHQLHKRFLICSIKFIAQPLTSLIWSNHFAWLKFKNKLNQKQIKLTIKELNNKVPHNYRLSQQ